MFEGLTGSAQGSLLIVNRNQTQSTGCKARAIIAQPSRVLFFVVVDIIDLFRPILSSPA